MKLTDLITPELYQKWHSEPKEIPGLLKQRVQRLAPLQKAFEHCVNTCGSPIPLPPEIELALILNLLITLDQLIEMATEPRHGTN